MEYIDFAKKILKSNSYRLTKPRLLVLKILAKNKKSLNSYEIVGLIESEGQKIDVSTVYRILEVYKVLNLVHFNAKKQRYSACQDFDCFDEKHCHHSFVCDGCGDTYEIHVTDVDLISLIQKSHKNLKITSHYLELYGLCEKCK